MGMKVCSLTWSKLEIMGQMEHIKAFSVVEGRMGLISNYMQPQGCPFRTACQKDAEEALRYGAVLSITFTKKLSSTGGGTRWQGFVDLTYFLSSFLSP